MSPASSTGARRRSWNDAMENEEDDDGGRKSVARKRKRLAKACDPCHKSKRRCDGKSPCGNCEFATKKCVYTDSMGRTVAAPHGRPEDLIALLFPKVPPPTSPVEHRYSDASSHHSSASPSDRPVLRPRGSPAQPDAVSGRPHQPPGVREPGTPRTSHPPYETPGGWPSPEQPGPNPIYARLSSTAPLPIDLDLKMELANLFFAQSYPFNLILHRPTFLSNLSQDAIPNYLLLCLFAIAAPLSNHPGLGQGPPWQKGEVFAEGARSLLFDAQGSLAVPSSLEVTQALCFLQVHEITLRRNGRTDARYMTLALDILRSFGVHRLDHEPQDPNEVADTPQNWLAKECYRRTFWLIYLIELLSAAFSDRPMSFVDRELVLFLPMPESKFEFTQIAGPQTDFLHAGAPGLSPPGEFGYLVRVATIYARIMGHMHENSGILHNQQKQHELTEVLHDCEKALHDWQCSLPGKLRFNEQTLRLQMTTFQIIGGAGWCFAFMHALSECAMLHLYEHFDHPPGLRSKEVVGNLIIILTALEKKGRSGIMMATLLLAIVRYYLGTRTQIDLSTASWCEEYQSLWGVSIAEMTSPAFRQEWVGTRAQVADISAERERPWQENVRYGDDHASQALGSATSNGGTYQFPPPPPPNSLPQSIAYGSLAYPLQRVHESMFHHPPSGTAPGPPSSFLGSPYTANSASGSSGLFGSRSIVQSAAPLHHQGPMLPPPAGTHESFFPSMAYPHHTTPIQSMAAAVKPLPYQGADPSRLQTPGLRVSGLTQSASSSSPATDRLSSVSPGGSQPPAKRAPVGLPWLVDEVSPRDPRHPAPSIT